MASWQPRHTAFGTDEPTRPPAGTTRSAIENTCLEANAILDGTPPAPWQSRHAVDACAASNVCLANESDVWHTIQPGVVTAAAPTANEATTITAPNTSAVTVTSFAARTGNEAPPVPRHHTRRHTSRRSATRRRRARHRSLPRGAYVRSRPRNSPCSTPSIAAPRTIIAATRRVAGGVSAPFPLSGRGCIGNIRPLVRLIFHILALMFLQE